MAEECSVCSSTENVTLNRFGLGICSDCLLEDNTVEFEEDDLEEEEYEDF